jgi:FtsP/CotA-like multicopper oxidase with cupredoxin domain
VIDRSKWYVRQRLPLLGLAVVLLLLAPLGYLWASSLAPDTYSVMDMGYADFGGGPVDPAHAAHGGGHGGAPGAVSVASLTGPAEGTPDVDVRLVARKERFELRSGEHINGYTINDTSPGPEIKAVQGDLVQVTLLNESVPDGVTLHWHGVNVPNAEDGVAGVTQDALAPGDSHVYRFVAKDAGTYWYHSHQISHEQVKDGLFGTLVVLPNGESVSTVSTAGTASTEVVAAVHTYDGRRTIAGATGPHRVDVAAGTTARVRLVNTDSGPLQTWVTGAPYKVLAIDGYDVRGATPVSDRTLIIPAGGRADLEVTTPADGRAVRIETGGGATFLVVGPPSAQLPVAARRPKAEFDLLGYGTPAALPFDAGNADRSFDFSIGRRPAFIDGRPGFWWTINGHLFPDVPMFVVAEGDVVRMTIKNSSGQVHPMHLHGHHAVVLSRDGEKATGSPWWVDSLDVKDGETYEIAFVADNPGIWMDHCHNLPHAAQGLIAHLAYTGVTEPFIVGGDAGNEPE